MPDPLGPEERRRYARQLRLEGVGEDGQRRLGSARVLVVGAGGLGSPALLYLAAAGIGTIGVVDDDRVEESNLHRQLAHRTCDVGRTKAESAAEAIRRVNPLVHVETRSTRLTGENASALIVGYDLVIDGTDDFPSRLAVADAAAAAGIPSVFGSVLGFDGQVAVFWPAAADGLGLTIRDLHPNPPLQADTCSATGVLGPLCGVVGSMMAAEAIKILTGTGRPLLGRVLVVDALDWEFREIPLASPRADRPATPDRVTTAHRVTAPAARGSDLPTTASSDEAVRASALRDLLAERERGDRDFLLVDVREPHERSIVAIPGDRHVPLQDLLERPAELLPADAEIVLYCHHGPRTRMARQRMLEAGFSDVRYLAGGVDAWAREVQPGLPRY